MDRRLDQFTTHFVHQEIPERIYLELETPGVPVGLILDGEPFFRGLWAAA